MGSEVVPLSPIPPVAPTDTQGFTVLARDFSGAHFFNTLVTSRGPAIRLGGRTLINASSDPLAQLPTPFLLPQGCRQRTHAVSSTPSRRSWAPRLCMKVGSSRNGGRRCKVRRHYHPPPQCIDFNPLRYSKLVRFCPPLFYPLRIRGLILRIWPRRARP